MAKTSKAHRKAPTVPTIKRLFSLSGNLCAFPECNELMVDKQGNVIGVMCHIEAAKEGGERFNPKQSAEERRAFDNLLLLCPKHHIVTNDVTLYTVEILTKMKKDHEKKYKHNQYKIEDAIAKAVLNNYINTTNISIGSNIVKGQQVLGNVYNFSLPRTEEELTIIDSIFSYVIENIDSAKKPVKSNSALLALNKKIALNFSDKSEQEEINEYFVKAYLKMSLVEQRFGSISTEQQNDISGHIFNLYKSLEREKKTNIEILNDLFMKFIPSGKETDPQHTALARAFVLMFFEDCTIFKKNPDSGR